MGRGLLAAVNLLLSVGLNMIKRRFGNTYVGVQEMDGLKSLVTAVRSEADGEQMVVLPPDPRYLKLRSILAKVVLTINEDICQENIELHCWLQSKVVAAVLLFFPDNRWPRMQHLTCSSNAVLYAVHCKI